MHALADSLNRFTRTLSTILLVLSGIFLLAMMALACANMGLRVFWVPIKGTYELMGFFGAVVAAFGLAATQLRKGHIALTILEGIFPKPVERIIDALGHATCCAFFALVAWRTWLWSLTLIQTGELSETLRVAYYPFPMAVALGNLVLALALACDMLQTLLPAPPATAASRPKEQAA